MEFKYLTIDEYSFCKDFLKKILIFIKNLYNLKISNKIKKKNYFVKNFIKLIKIIIINLFN